MFKAVQLLRGAKSFIRLVKDPNRLNEVFNLSDQNSQKKILEDLAEQFARSPRGEQALQEGRRLPRYDLKELVRLPEGTLGRVFADHMISNQLDPAAIPTLVAKDRGEYLRAHLYETHDLWHVVVGFGTDVAGELGLQSFYAAQFRGPLPSIILAAGLLNTAFYALPEADKRMQAIATGWIAGKESQALFGVHWDEYWQTPIADVRSTLGMDPRGVASRLELVT